MQGEVIDIFPAAEPRPLPDDGWNGASPASMVTAVSNGVIGPSSGPSSTSVAAGAGGASAFSRRPSDTARKTAATAP